jgi:hypothetical protein
MMDNAVKNAQLFVSAKYKGGEYELTLTEQTGPQVYTRTYRGTINSDDEITFPNDLSSRVQTLCVATALNLKYPSTYEGDSRPGAASTRMK